MDTFLNESAVVDKKLIFTERDFREIEDIHPSLIRSLDRAGYTKMTII